MKKNKKSHDFMKEPHSYNALVYSFLSLVKHYGIKSEEVSKFRGFFVRDKVRTEILKLLFKICENKDVVFELLVKRYCLEPSQFPPY